MSFSVRRDRGAATTEMVLITPVLILLLLLIALAGRYSTARADVTGAARDGARAASIERSAPAAAAAGEQAARDSLMRTGIACDSVDVTSDVSGFAAGGIVEVEVACQVRLGDLGLLAIPGNKTIVASSAEPVDTYRALD
jgi:Flp pilus assembly protein TadG